MNAPTPSIKQPKRTADFPTKGPSDSEKGPLFDPKSPEARISRDKNKTESRGSKEPLEHLKASQDGHGQHFVLMNRHGQKLKVAMTLVAEDDLKDISRKNQKSLKSSPKVKIDFGKYLETKRKELANKKGLKPPLRNASGNSSKEKNAKKEQVLLPNRFKTPRISFNNEEETIQLPMISTRNDSIGRKTSEIGASERQKERESLVYCRELGDKFAQTQNFKGTGAERRLTKSEMTQSTGRLLNKKGKKAELERDISHLRNQEHFKKKFSEYSAFRSNETFQRAMIKSSLLGSWERPRFNSEVDVARDVSFVPQIFASTSSQNANDPTILHYEWSPSNPESLQIPVINTWELSELAISTKEALRTKNFIDDCLNISEMVKKYEVNASRIAFDSLIILHNQLQDPNNPEIFPVSKETNSVEALCFLSPPHKLAESVNETVQTLKKLIPNIFHDVPCSRQELEKLLEFLQKNLKELHRTQTVQKVEKMNILATVSMHEVIRQIHLQSSEKGEILIFLWNMYFKIFFRMIEQAGQRASFVTKKVLEEFKKKSEKTKKTKEEMKTMAKIHSEETEKWNVKAQSQKQEILDHLEEEKALQNKCISYKKALNDCVGILRSLKNENSFYKQKLLALQITLSFTQEGTKRRARNVLGEALMECPQCTKRLQESVLAKNYFEEEDKPEEPDTEFNELLEGNYDAKNDKEFKEFYDLDKEEEIKEFSKFIQEAKTGICPHCNAQTGKSPLEMIDKSTEANTEHLEEMKQAQGVQTEVSTTTGEFRIVFSSMSNLRNAVGDFMLKKRFFKDNVDIFSLEKEITSIELLADFIMRKNYDPVFFSAAQANARRMTFLVPGTIQSIEECPDDDPESKEEKKKESAPRLMIRRGTTQSMQNLRHMSHIGGFGSNQSRGLLPGASSREKKFIQIEEKDNRMAQIKTQKNPSLTGIMAKDHQPDTPTLGSFVEKESPIGARSNQSLDSSPSFSPKPQIARKRGVGKPKEINEVSEMDEARAEMSSEEERMEQKDDPKESQSEVLEEMKKLIKFELLINGVKATETSFEIKKPHRSKFRTIVKYLTALKYLKIENQRVSQLENDIKELKAQLLAMENSMKTWRDEAQDNQKIIMKVSQRFGVKLESLKKWKDTQGDSDDDEFDLSFAGSKSSSHFEEDEDWATASKPQSKMLNETRDEGKLFVVPEEEKNMASDQNSPGFPMNKASEKASNKKEVDSPNSGMAEDNLSSFSEMTHKPKSNYLKMALAGQKIKENPKKKGEKEGRNDRSDNSLKTEGTPGLKIPQRKQGSQLSRSRIRNLTVLTPKNTKEEPVEFDEKPEESRKREENDQKNQMQLDETKPNPRKFTRKRSNSHFKLSSNLGGSEFSLNEPVDPDLQNLQNERRRGTFIFQRNNNQRVLTVNMKGLSVKSSLKLMPEEKKPAMQLLEKAKTKKTKKNMHFFPLKLVLKQISSFYSEKMHSKDRDSREEGLASFVYNIYRHQYGASKFLDQKFVMLVLSLRKYQHILRVNTFAKFMQINNPESNYSLDDLDKYLEALEFFQTSNMGISIQNSDTDQTHYVPMIRVLEFFRYFSDKKMAPEDINKFRGQIQRLKERDPTGANTFGIINMDVFMVKLIGLYREMVQKTKLYVESAFNAADLDGNGYIEPEEFMILWKHLNPERFNFFECDRVFNANSLVVSSTRCLTFEKFAHVCFSENLFKLESQLAFCGLKHKEDLEGAFEEARLEWPILKGKLQLRIENCEALDGSRVKWWRSVISRLSDLVEHCDESLVLSFLISVNIIDKETKDFLGAYFDGPTETSKKDQRHF